MDFFEIFDPLKRFSQSEYLSLWQYLFATLLSGFWARLLASLFLLFSLWFGVYRRRLGLGIGFFVLSVFIAYFGGLARIMFWWWG